MFHSYHLEKKYNIIILYKCKFKLKLKVYSIYNVCLLKSTQVWMVCTLKHTPLAANTQSHTQSITVTFSHIGCFPNITYCFEQAGFLTKSASLTFSSFSFSTLQPLSSCFLPLIPFLHPLSWLFQSVRSFKSEETDGTQGLRWWKLLILEIKSTNRNRWWNKYCSFGENLIKNG